MQQRDILILTKKIVETISFCLIKMAMLVYDIINMVMNMIKVIAFDLVGVLVSEKDIEMSLEESKIERLFGPNKSDDEYINDALKIINDEDKLIETTYKLLTNLYEVKDNNLLNKLKTNYPNIKIVIATNHITFIKKFINENFDIKYLEEIFISADINKIKPNKDFYEEIVNKMSCNPSEILFLDDNQDNIDGAKSCGLNTIKVEKNMYLFEEIEKIIFENNMEI